MATHAALRKLRKLRTDTLLPKSMRWVTDFETKLLKAYKKVGKQVEVEKARTLKKAEKPVPKITREDLNNLNLTEDDLEASVCKASFYEFVKAMWEAVSAEVPVWNWHVKYLCDRIQEIAERVFKGLPRLNDLVVNISPGTTKSTIFSVMLPAWCWTRMPNFQFIGVSYSEKLAIDLSVKCRDVVRCDKYRRLFPEVEWRSDQDVKCLAEGTEVLMADGTLRKIEDLKQGDKVQSSDGMKVKTDTVVAVQETGVKPVFKITLCDGTAVKATENHRLFGERGWQFVRDMKAGDKLRVVKETANQNGGLSRDDAFLLALWLADGVKRCTGFRFTVGDAKAGVLERAKEVCAAKGWDVKHSEGSGYVVSCGRRRNGDTPANFLRRFGLYRAKKTHAIRIPDEVMRASSPAVLEFLGTYLSCAGTVTTYNGEVSYTAVSRRMAKDLKTLLKRIGVQCSTWTSQGTYKAEDGSPVLCRTAYRVAVKRANSVINLQQLPVYAAEKASRLADLVHAKKVWLATRMNLRGDKDLRMQVPNAPDLEFRTIKSVEECPPVRTYDIQTRVHNAFFAETVLSHNSFFKNTRGGWRFCAGTNGTVTGYHAHMIVVDDPINPNESVSEQELNTANRWLTETLSSRKVDKKVTPTVLVMQRLHQDDPSAQFLRRKNVAHVCLPAEKTDLVQPPELVANYKNGLMDPVRLDRTVLAEEKGKGQYYYASQFLQTPVPRGGGMFKVDRVKALKLPDPKAFVMRCRYWDKAGTLGGSGAYTVGVLMARDMEGRFWVLDVKRVRLDSAEREALIRRTAEQDGLDCVVGVEQEPGSGGKGSAEDTVRRLAGWRVVVQKVDKSTGGKEFRADPFSVQVNMGNVACDVQHWSGQPGSNTGFWETEWVKDFWDELKFFPRSRYLDQVDAASGAFSILAAGTVVCGPVND